MFSQLQSYEEEKRQHEDLRGKHQRLTLVHAEVKQEVKAGDYKVDNFDRIQRYDIWWECN